MEAGTGTRKALCVSVGGERLVCADEVGDGQIGISFVGSSNALAGCINDAWNVNKASVELLRPSGSRDDVLTRSAQFITG